MKVLDSFFLALALGALIGALCACVGCASTEPSRGSLMDTLPPMQWETTPLTTSITNR